jgi:hypothetical protein
MERRALRRHLLQASAAIELINEELIPVHLIDINAEGARIKLATPMPAQPIAAVLLGGRRYPSSIVWENEAELGIAFDGMGSGEDPVLKAVADVLADLEGT